MGNLLPSVIVLFMLALTRKAHMTESNIEDISNSIRSLADEIKSLKGVIEKREDTWPSISTAKCTQKTKQKAMYGRMTFQPSLRVEPLTSMSVDVEWNDLKFNPSNTRKIGGVYISYTTGMSGGPGGYFGVQIKSNGGTFLFSIWDGDRWEDKAGGTPKPSTRLSWPMDMNRCKRNCQDCGMGHLGDTKKSGMSTGTQCKLVHRDMQVGDKFRVTLVKLKHSAQIDTRTYGGMPPAHAVFGEVDRSITGSVWEMKVQDMKTNKKMTVGKIMFEGDAIGMDRLGTFDEMLGCNKCNAIYHKDTRSNLKVTNKDGRIHYPTKTEGKTKAPESTCQDYMITGRKEDKSITFEGGPLTTNKFFLDGRYHNLW